MRENCPDWDVRSACVAFADCLPSGLFPVIRLRRYPSFAAGRDAFGRYLMKSHVRLATSLREYGAKVHAALGVIWRRRPTSSASSQLVNRHNNSNYHHNFKLLGGQLGNKMHVVRFLIPAILYLLLYFATSLSNSFAQGTSPESPKIQFFNLDEGSDQQVLIQNFEENLKLINNSAKIQSCAYSVRTSNGGRDYIFGSICRVSIEESIKTIMMCNDKILGEFTIRLSGYSNSRDSVENFVKENCL